MKCGTVFNHLGNAAQLCVVYIMCLPFCDGQILLNVCNLKIIKRGQCLSVYLCFMGIIGNRGTLN